MDISRESIGITHVDIHIHICDIIVLGEIPKIYVLFCVFPGEHHQTAEILPNMMILTY